MVAIVSYLPVVEYDWLLSCLSCLSCLQLHGCHCCSFQFVNYSAQPCELAYCSGSRPAKFLHMPKPTVLNILSAKVIVGILLQYSGEIIEKQHLSLKIHNFRTQTSELWLNRQMKDKNGEAFLSYTSVPSIISERIG